MRAFDSRLASRIDTLDLMSFWGPLRRAQGFFGCTQLGKVDCAVVYCDCGLVSNVSVQKGQPYVVVSEKVSR